MNAKAIGRQLWKRGERALARSLVEAAEKVPFQGANWDQVGTCGIALEAHGQGIARNSDIDPNQSAKACWTDAQMAINTIKMMPEEYERVEPKKMKVGPIISKLESAYKDMDKLRKKLPTW